MAFVFGGHLTVQLDEGFGPFWAVREKVCISAFEVDVDLRHRTGLLCQQTHEVSARDNLRTGLAFAIKVLYSSELGAHFRNEGDVRLVSHCVRSFSFSVVD